MEKWESLTKQLVTALERANIREYACLMCNPKRLIWISFVAGLFRGLGGAIGFSVLGAVALVIINRIFGVG